VEGAGSRRSLAQRAPFPGFAGTSPRGGREGRGSFADLADSVAGRLAINEGGEVDAAAGGADRVAAHHPFEVVVGALDQHVGQQALDQGQRRLLVEGEDAVHVADGRDHLGALLEAVDRPVRPLQGTHAGVGVEGDDEPVALRPGGRQQGDMAGVDEVETAVGEADR
jgi:hypothetical protein